MNEAVIVQIKQYLSDTLSNIANSKNIRGTKRTEKLHSLCFEVFKSMNDGDYEVEYEVRNKRDGYGRTFDIDVLVYQNDATYAILAKSIQSDYNKNGNNYTNTICGEVVRTLGSSSTLKVDKVIFMNFVPLVCPSFKGNVVKWQKTKHLTTNETIKDLISAFRNKVEIVNIYYQISDYASIKTKEQFSDLTPDRIEIILNK